jgi:hypothetical protein
MLTASQVQRGDATQAAPGQTVVDTPAPTAVDGDIIDVSNLRCHRVAADVHLCHQDDVVSAAANTTGEDRDDQHAINDAADAFIPAAQPMASRREPRSRSTSIRDVGGVKHQYVLS